MILHNITFYSIENIVEESLNLINKDSSIEYLQWVGYVSYSDLFQIQNINFPSTSFSWGGTIILSLSLFEQSWSEAYTCVYPVFINKFIFENNLGQSLT